MVLCDMYKDDDSIFKNNQDMWGISYLLQSICHMHNRATFLLRM